MQQQIFPINTAIFDPTKKYRYLLTRKICEKDTICTFIMLNPSTADEIENDPTVARCVKFAKVWGYGKLNVLNIFALRSTDPGGLYTIEDPVGQDNDHHIVETVRNSDLVIAAWGVHAALNDRGKQVEDLIVPYTDIHCLSVTKDGYPGHPLYLRNDSKPVLYRERESAHAERL